MYKHAYTHKRRDTYKHVCTHYIYTDRHLYKHADKGHTHIHLSMTTYLYLIPLHVTWLQQKLRMPAAAAKKPCSAFDHHRTQWDCAFTATP